MRTKHIMVALMALVLGTATVSAQKERDNALVQSEKNGWEFEVKAGLNIGGSSPIPLPKEIRKIKSYSPRMNASVEGVATKWFADKGPWGLSLGLKFEEKGMITGAKTKNYHTEIIYGEQKIAGYYTGYVKTKYNSTFLTLPVMANYRFNNRFKARAGLFFSYRMDGEFTGHVSDGYLRSGTPTGERITFDEGSQANYDFSSDLRHFMWGAQAGVTWRAYKHFTLNGDLTWGFNNIFKGDFNTITFNMYPIYLNIGFGYTF